MEEPPHTKEWYDCDRAVANNAATITTSSSWIPSALLLMAALGILIWAILYVKHDISFTLRLYNANRVRRSSFEPDEEIMATITSSKSRDITWELSIDNGNTWTPLQVQLVSLDPTAKTTHATAGAINTITFKVTSWSTRCLIRATENSLQQTASFSVSPTIQLISGPGARPTEDVVDTNRAATIQLQWTYTALDDATFAFFLSSAASINWITQSTDEWSVDTDTQILTWTPDQAFATQHIRYKLSATLDSKTTEVISNEIFDQNSDAPTDPFTITSLVITDKTLTAGKSVTIQAIYTNATWPKTTQDFFYRTGGQDTVIHPLVQNDDGKTRTWTYTLPTLDHDVNDFQVGIRYNGDQQEIVSDPYTIATDFIISALALSSTPTDTCFRTSTTIQLTVTAANGNLSDHTLTWERALNGADWTPAIVIATNSPNNFTHDLPDTSYATYTLRVNGVALPQPFCVHDPSQDFIIHTLTLSPEMDIYPAGRYLTVAVGYTGTWQTPSFTYTLNDAPAVSITALQVSAGVMTLYLPSGNGNFVLHTGDVASKTIAITSDPFYITLTRNDVSSKTINGQIALNYDFDVTWGGYSSDVDESLTAPFFQLGTWEYETTSIVPWRALPTTTPQPVVVSTSQQLTAGKVEFVSRLTYQFLLTQWEGVNIRFTYHNQHVQFDTDVPVHLQWDYPNFNYDTVDTVLHGQTIDGASNVHKTVVTTDIADMTSCTISPFISHSDTSQEQEVDYCTIMGQSGTSRVYWIPPTVTNGSYWFGLVLHRNGQVLQKVFSRDLIPFQDDGPRTVYSSLSVLFQQGSLYATLDMTTDLVFMRSGAIDCTFVPIIAYQATADDGKDPSICFFQNTFPICRIARRDGLFLAYDNTVSTWGWFNANDLGNLNRWPDFYYEDDQGGGFAALHISPQGTRSWKRVGASADSAQDEPRYFVLEGSTNYHETTFRFDAANTVVRALRG